jgi:hypothetical protein
MNDNQSADLLHVSAIGWELLVLVAIAIAVVAVLGLSGAAGIRWAASQSIEVFVGVTILVTTTLFVVVAVMVHRWRKLMGRGMLD